MPGHRNRIEMDLERNPNDPSGRGYGQHRSVEPLRDASMQNPGLLPQPGQKMTKA